MDKLYISSYTKHESLAHIPKGKCAKSPLLFLGKSIDSCMIYNPAFMIKHPKTNRIYDTFYICLESIQTGHIAVISDNKLKQIVTCGGKSSCFLAFDPTFKYMININYWDSSISIHNINSENYLLSEPISIKTYVKSLIFSPIPKRRKSGQLMISLMKMAGSKLDPTL